MQKYQTKQRITLLDFLEKHADQLLSAQQISDGLSAHAISLSTVYRNLSALETEGKVSRHIRADKGEIYYKYIDSDICRRHLHLSCKKCGKIYHMSVRETEQLIDAVAQSDRFWIDKGDTVLYGICNLCRNV